jgi:hypothetical protein
VGGLTLGGGLSFLSANYGLVCDTVVNYEIVLANASIANVNASSNSDLFWALKGVVGISSVGPPPNVRLKNELLILTRYCHQVYHESTSYRSGSCLPHSSQTPS